MTLDHEICIQFEITERTRLFFILINVRKNIESYNKEKDEKKNTTNYKNKIDIKKKRVRKSRTEISKETINISKRQE